MASNDQSSKPAVKVDPPPPPATVVVVGDVDAFKLLCMSSCDSQGWVHTTKAMQVPGGCLVQSGTTQLNKDGTYTIAESLAFVPGVAIIDDVGGGRKLVSAQPPPPVMVGSSCVSPCTTKTSH